MSEPIVIIQIEDGQSVITQEYNDLNLAITEWKIDKQRVEWFKHHGSISIVSDAYTVGDGIYLSKVNSEYLKGIFREYRLNKILQ